MSVEKSKQKLSDRYSSTNNSNNNAKKKNSSANWMLIIVSIVILLAVAGTIFVASLGKSDNGKDSINPNAYNLVVAPDDIDKQLEERTSTVAPGSYDVCMNNDWKFDNARSSSRNAYVENITTNTNTVYFEIIRNDTEECIYHSPFIPVGSSLKNVKLNNEQLTKGTYKCTLVYHLVDSDYNDISHVNISLNVIIEND